MTNAFVRRIAASGNLTETDIGLLTEATQLSRDVKSHRDLIREGDPPGGLFIVLEGWASRYKLLPNGARQITSFLMPGDFCDLHADELVEMDHSIGTLTDCRIKLLPRNLVEALIVATPSLTKAFWHAQLIDEGVLRSWIVNNGRRDSNARVAHLMLELYVRMRSIGLAGEGKCNMPLTQIVLSDALGLTPVHINRVLRNLKNLGTMFLGAKMLTITDPFALGKIAGFDDNYLHRKLKHAA